LKNDPFGNHGKIKYRDIKKVGVTSTQSNLNNINANLYRAEHIDSSNPIKKVKVRRKYH
jgi:hypothetical protein